MSMFTVTDASQVFHLTDAAAAKVKSLIEAEDGADDARAAGRGPSRRLLGLQLRDVLRHRRRRRRRLQVEHGGVRVVIDPASQPHLKGATLDYKDGLQGAGFSINNPNAERSCGCGQSFS